MVEALLSYWLSGYALSSAPMDGPAFFPLAILIEKGVQCIGFVLSSLVVRMARRVR